MKRILLPLFLTLACSGAAHAAVKSPYTGPDCSADTDSRIFEGIWVSLHVNREKYKQYIDDLSQKDSQEKITLLSSEKITKDEAKRLMLRRLKMDGETEADLKNGGKEAQYLGGDLYRQYYLIESSSGFKAIAKYYSAVFSRGTGPIAISCGADLEEIHIISDTINGHTADFASR